MAAILKCRRRAGVCFSRAGIHATVQPAHHAQSAPRNECVAPRCRTTGQRHDVAERFRRQRAGEDHSMKRNSILRSRPPSMRWPRCRCKARWRNAAHGGGAAGWHGGGRNAWRRWHTAAGAARTAAAGGGSSGGGWHGGGGRRQLAWRCSHGGDWHGSGHWHGGYYWGPSFSFYAGWPWYLGLSVLSVLSVLLRLRRIDDRL